MWEVRRLPYFVLLNAFSKRQNNVGIRIRCLTFVSKCFEYNIWENPIASFLYCNHRFSNILKDANLSCVLWFARTEIIAVVRQQSDARRHKCVIESFIHFETRFKINKTLLQDWRRVRIDLSRLTILQSWKDLLYKQILYECQRST